MASRSLDDLVPELKEKAIKHQELCKDAGIEIIITCTARLVKEQIALYAQGRQPLDEVNELRRIAGLWPISEEANQRKVTWTLNSRHLIDLEDVNLYNDKARAYDIAIVRDEKNNWDVKADINENEIADYEEAARLGESLGLTAGARFKSPDWVHFEWSRRGELNP